MREGKGLLRKGGNGAYLLQSICYFLAGWACKLQTDKKRDLKSPEQMLKKISTWLGHKLTVLVCDLCML